MPYVYAPDRPLVSRLLPALAALLLLLAAGPTHAQIVPGVYPVGPDGDYETLEAALSFYESKTAIIREAIRAYLADPTHVLPSSA